MDLERFRKRTSTPKEQRPFHETIIDAINLAADRDELTLISWLIKATKIPEGHDEISRAWHHRAHEFIWPPPHTPEDWLGVVASLEEQKKKVPRVGASSEG